MNVKILVPVIIIVIAILGGVFWWVASQLDEAASNNNTQPTPTPTPELAVPESTESGSESVLPASDNVVTLTENGFEPANLVVPVGAEVQFVNESGQGMWVASDPHPVHTDYADFDQKEVGDTYSFTFTEPGAYTYHNHQNESQTGLVLVEE